ncbi:hypothetical protein [Methylobacterium mesophilicum]
MRAAAALFALLLAAPAAAGCKPVPSVVEDLRGRLPATAHVAEISATVTPTILAWLESEGLPRRADRLIQVAGPRGVALILIEGETVCDGPQAVELLGDQAVALARLVQRFRQMRGWGPELPA